MGGFGGPKWHAEDIILPDAPKDKITLLSRPKGSRQPLFSKSSLF
jgi:hypothetical protein